MWGRLAARGIDPDRPFGARGCGHQHGAQEREIDGAEKSVLARHT